MQLSIEENLTSLSYEEILRGLFLAKALRRAGVQPVCLPTDYRKRAQRGTYSDRFSKLFLTILHSLSFPIS